MTSLPYFFTQYTPEQNLKAQLERILSPRNRLPDGITQLSPAAQEETTEKPRWRRNQETWKARREHPRRRGCQRVTEQVRPRSYLEYPLFSSSTNGVRLPFNSFFSSRFVFRGKAGFGNDQDHRDSCLEGNRFLFHFQKTSFFSPCWRMDLSIAFKWNEYLVSGTTFIQNALPLPMLSTGCTDLEGSVMTTRSNNSSKLGSHA